MTTGPTHAPGLKSIEDALAIRRKMLLALERAETETDAAAPTGAADLRRHRRRPDRGRDGRRNRRARSPLGVARFPQHHARTARASSWSKPAIACLPSFPEALVRQAPSSRLQRAWRRSPSRRAGRRYRRRLCLLRLKAVIFASHHDLGGRRRGITCGRVAQRGSRSQRPGHRRAGPSRSRSSEHLCDWRHCSARRRTAPRCRPSRRSPSSRDRYVADLILAAAKRPFRYRDFGNLATIGRKPGGHRHGIAATCSGFLAWLIWSVAHVWFLIGFRSRLAVTTQLAVELPHLSTQRAPDHRRDRRIRRPQARSAPLERKCA